MTIADNCILCAHKILVLCFSPFGIGGALTFICNHNSNKKSDVKLSKIYVYISTVLVFLIGTVTVLDIYLFIEEGHFELLITFKLITDALLQVSIIMAQSSFIYKTHLRIIEYKGLILLTKTAQYLGIENIFDVKTIKIFRLGTLITVIIMQIFFGFYGIYIATHANAFSLLELLKHIISCFSFWLDVGTVLLFTFLGITYNLIVKKCHGRCKILLENAISKNYYKYNYRNIDVELKNLRRLLMAIYSNFKVMELIVNPVVVVWFAMLLLMITLNVYILIKVIIANVEEIYDISYKTLQVRVVVILVALTASLYYLEQHYRSVSIFNLIY